MRIVFDVTPLSHPRTGIGNYMLGMLGGLAEVAGDTHELVFFAPTGPRNAAKVREALDGIDGERRILRLPPPSTLWRKLWSRTQLLPVERIVGSLDVFHLSDWMYPPQRSGLRTTTVHDLGPIHYPEWVDPRTRALHVPKALHAAQTCDILFTNSQYTADDVERTLGVARERITVALPGIDGRFQPGGDRADIGSPYLFTAASFEPRKNLETLLAAFSLVRAQRPELKLLIAGSTSGFVTGTEPPGAQLLGYVPDRDLPALYRGAAAFVFPSLFEGFGIPVVEAMACGTPVVVSSHPSLDEASDTAAIRVEPTSAEALAAGIERALTEGRELIPAGLEHASRFTWRRCGEAMLRAYESALEPQQ
jgi:glycosyltransferase involved in cell wall biosynthesis